jgi:hypothetical protein
MSAADGKPSNRLSLPEEVIKELEWSAVGAIKILRQHRGIGLYEAKLAIDAYLEQHPEHPRAPRESQQSQIQDQPAQSPFVELPPIAGSPIPLELLPNRTALPLAYVVAQADLPDHGKWFGDLLKVCLRALKESSIQILDEKRRSEAGDIVSVAVKIVEPADSNSLKDLLRVLEQHLPKEINWSLVHAGSREDAAEIPLEAVEVEYFLQEFSYRSYMVASTTNCVRLKHLPTGISCRSTAHRGRTQNYEEALLLLSSLLKAAMTCSPESVPAQRNNTRATKRKRDAQEQVHGRTDHWIHQAG